MLLLAARRQGVSLAMNGKCCVFVPDLKVSFLNILYWLIMELYCCTILYCTILYCTMLYNRILCYNTPYHTILYYTMPYHAITYHSILYHTMLQYIILYHATPYHPITYLTILYYIILYHTMKGHSCYAINPILCSLPKGKSSFNICKTKFQKQINPKLHKCLHTLAYMYICT